MLNRCALIAGVASDALGYGGAISLVAGLTAVSGLWVLGDMPAARGPRHSTLEELTETVNSPSGGLAPGPP